MTLCPQYGSRFRRKMGGNMMQNPRTTAVTAIFPITEGFKVEEYRSGSQTATYRSNAIATRTDDSTMKLKWVKNICVMQASKEISLALNQKIASILGTVVVESMRSATASMARKRYMGSWRLRSVMMTKRRTELPNTAVMYIKQKGTEIQMWDSSMPGMPVRTKVIGSKLLSLSSYMMLQSSVSA